MFYLQCDGIVKGAKFCLIFSFAYKGLEWVFKDQYHLADFLVDMAKTALAAAGAWAVGTVLLSSAVVGGSVVAVGLIVFLVGVGITMTLDYIDKQYGLSEKVI
ncbi:TPA: hypothetical protein SMP74_002609 [Proteus mirabilis]|uniref:hypothetical protein n=1 Tax=Proteus mirabilis TaxID=584 RepID=UPI000665F4CC|nr:hypothetical protein [Proteus mirabilis]EBN0092492.1 hypothetical protein [Salmonella enterica subsp. enterica serovar Virchow]ELA7683106.1 hypothetical protein [Proteus mirabilis]MBB6653542.1 hypothetical protein [Proteus mirabilis]MBI6206395.1 hypothetical protein [Proteus mirabilis]MBI6373913.1 hypothetical protein [Proteus mirabilis]